MEAGENYMENANNLGYEDYMDYENKHGYEDYEGYQDYEDYNVGKNCSFFLSKASTWAKNHKMPVYL